MIEIQAHVRGIQDLYRQVGVFDQQSRKALNTAIRVEGYRLMRLLQRQVRQGAPGGRRFAPLSFIARVMGHRGRNEPLKALSQAVKYLVPKSDPIEFRFGFVGPVNRSMQREMGARGSQLISKSWLYIAKALQEGVDLPAEREIKRGARTREAAFARYGARQSGRRGVHQARSRYFFIRKTTRRYHTPARPIIDPFWRAERSGVSDRIRDNFRRKLAGERI